MKVTFLGTGVAVPYGKKAQSSILVQLDGLKVLVDAGYGSMLRLEEAKVSPSELDALLVTHHHTDHNGEIMNILKARWLLGCEENLILIGPAGTKAFFRSLQESYAYLTGKLRVEIMEVEEGKYRVNELEFEAIPTVHSIKSVGYLIGDVAISGDTKAVKEFLSLECRAIVHELSLPFGFTADYHTTPENLKENLKYCRADRIYLTHIYPFTQTRIDEILAYLREGVEVEIKVAEDLISFRL